jgi:hypothetical protein
MTVLTTAQAEASSRARAESGLTRTTMNEPSDSMARISAGGAPAKLNPEPR